MTNPSPIPTQVEVESVANGLVKRLRITAGMISMGELIAWGSDTALMQEAANYIEAIAASQAAPAKAEGWQLVPIEPTPEMIDAFTGKLDGACGSFFEWECGGDEGYRAMLAAAPFTLPEKNT